ncbi:MarR family winged helix-turn-helix transcriptional regulator [Sebaldella sp. S0638]|uniref:MarR family winged helix-turn-helix transcriptional regulator n=1 Tax=Sebaldella sp. S0638 TaxID=2957809 RepID=UPI0020A16754|nr:MarR family transcriptional regulator [Sebaldella sp. S0638]MCP1223179.1 MarR family transcriptional regulator [Sebaldella sp. S0638]
MKNSNLIKEIVNTGRLYKSVFIRTADLKTKSDIKPSEKNALMELSGHKELSMSVLNKKLSVSKQQLTAITGSLRKKRYVERYTDDNNLRVAHVRITDEGRKALKDTYSEAERKLSNKLECLSAGEITELESSIKTLKKLLEKMNR